MIVMQQIKNKHNLLDARKKDLEQIAYGSIRPHGKLWGMDVFSWDNPDVDTMTSTVHAFPFPVIWLAPSGFLTEAVDFDATILSNIHAAISYDKTPSDTEKIPNLITTNDVETAFQKMSEFRLKRGVILFCYSGADSEYYKNAFKAYLAIHQI